MQNEPAKTVGNYNEYHGANNREHFSHGSFDIQIEEQDAKDYRESVETGAALVNHKIDEILGAGNRLTQGNLALPTVRFVVKDESYPDYGGYYWRHKNEITIITGNLADNSRSRTKVFIHEYLHFLSHNGYDRNEQISADAPLATRSNVGFRRDSGLDIRSGREGQKTHDYFSSFNEAVTEQLAIDIFPDAHATYDDYRGLLNQVLDDAVAKGLGGNNAAGTFEPWTREQFKTYVYRCYFKGNLEGFTKLLQTIYDEFDISEQQFGLMTHRDDLPSLVENIWRSSHPDSPPPSPSAVRAMVQERLDRKTPDDYVTDVIGPTNSPDSNNETRYGAEYDTYIAENNIGSETTVTIEGNEYEIDNQGFTIYRGELAKIALERIKTAFDGLFARLERGEIDLATVSDKVDTLLFETYGMSMLSDGFREFYIYKHAKLDSV